MPVASYYRSYLYYCAVPQIGPMDKVRVADVSPPFLDQRRSIPMVLLRTACLHSQTPSTKEKGPQFTSPLGHLFFTHPLTTSSERGTHPAHPRDKQTPFTFHSHCFSNSNHLLKSRNTRRVWWQTTGRERRPEHRPCTRPATPYPASTFPTIFPPVSSSSLFLSRPYLFAQLKYLLLHSIIPSFPQFTIHLHPIQI